MASEDWLRVERVPAPVRAQVIDNLRRAIISREFRPGQRLIERELVEMTGVSRTSIREALIKLAAEGLVTATPNKGTMVATVTPTQAREIYQIRSVLEGLAGRLFVENATDEHKKAIEKQLAKIDRLSARNAAILDAKDRFYAILFTGADNELLRSMAASLHARVMYLRWLSLSLPGRPKQSVAELHEIMEAVRNNDSERAQKACIRHVEEAMMAALAALER